MHELSIAVDLVEHVSQAVVQTGSERVSRVYLRVGAFSGVVADALTFAFDVAAAGTALEGAVLEIERVPVVVFCPACRDEQVLEDVYRFCCPTCGTPTPDIRRGRELELTAVEIEEPL